MIEIGGHKKNKLMIIRRRHRNSGRKLCKQVDGGEYANV